MLLMTTITGKKWPGKLYISGKKIVFRSTRKTSIRNTKTGEKIYNFSYVICFSGFTCIMMTADSRLIEACYHSLFILSVMLHVLVNQFSNYICEPTQNVTNIYFFWVLKHLASMNSSCNSSLFYLLLVSFSLICLKIINLEQFLSKIQEKFKI